MRGKARMQICALIMVLSVGSAMAFNTGVPHAISRERCGRNHAVHRRAAPRLRAAARPRMQVWSNNEAIEQYRNLLSGKEEVREPDRPSVIVGDGAVASVFREGGGGEDLTVRRGESIPLEWKGQTSFPIYICVPEDELEGIIRACPKEKVDDLVFISTGNIELLLKKYSLCGNDNTQIVPYFTIFDKGSRPQDCLVDLGKDAQGCQKYAAETTVCGKWAGPVSDRLERLGLHCRTVFYMDWRRIMIERCVFESVFNLVGVLHKDQKDRQGVTLGEVGLYYAAEVEDMIVEINRALRGSMAITLMMGIEERLFAYAQHPNIDFRKAKVEKFKWRNGFFYAMSQQAKDMVVNGVKVEFPDPCPKHTAYIEYAKEIGMVQEDLEPYSPYGATFEG